MADPEDPQRRSWLDSATHRQWLRDQALTTLRFFRAGVKPNGTFISLDDDGRPIAVESVVAQGQQLLNVTRMVHAYAAGEMLGVPGSGAIVDAGLSALWNRHRDQTYGGYYSALPFEGEGTTAKQAYAHAHVLLAASGALAAGHLSAAPVLDDVLAVIDEHFWDEQAGAMREDFSRDWSQCDDYRGANSNMHSTEAFLAAAAATGRNDLARRADRIATKFIDGFARSNGWLIPEHFDSSWNPEPGYNHDRLDDPFRPYGATVGHSFEWARLTLGAAQATGASDGWHLNGARALFDRGISDGWDHVHGGIAYTLDWDGRPANPDHYWWPISEGIQAASYLHRLTGDAKYEDAYHRCWDFALTNLIDEVRGGWYAQLDPENRRKSGPWYGKPDVYHTLQAALMPLLPMASSLLGAVEASF